MKKKLLFVCAAAVASVITGCCCNQPGCVEEEAVIIATPVQPQKKCTCKPKCTCHDCGCGMSDKKSCPTSGKTVANNIAGCSGEQGNCPVPTPAPAPAPAGE